MIGICSRFAEAATGPEGAALGAIRGVYEAGLKNLEKMFGGR